MFRDNFAEPLKLTNHGIRLPEFKLADEDYGRYGISKDASNLEILTAICRAGFREKLDSGVIPKEKKREYEDRVKYEIDVLTKTSFTDYILIVWDVMNFVRKNNIARGRARGSAAGSLVNYLIGITDVDSIKYGLFWERFISEARAQTVEVDGVKYLAGSSPDVDLDVGDEDRYKVIDYVSQKYNNRFVKLSTTGTLTTKILTKEIGKIYGKTEEEMNFVTSSIPVVFGKTPNPTKCYEDSEGYKKFIDETPGVFEASNYLHEGINHTGSHASAYSVSYDKLEDFMPCQLGSDGELVSTYDMYEAQNLSVKLDLLGVQTINLIQRVADRVGIDLNKVDIDSWDNIYKYLQQLEHPYGLFQISGHTAIKATNKIKPKNIEQIAGVLSVGRPGALSFLDQYADYTNNGTIQDCPKEFVDILGPTGGVCLYQESLMSLFCRLGFSLVDANTIRDIVGKKKTDKIAEWEPKIYEMARKNGISEEAAKYAWDVAKASADYSFNLCIFEKEKVELKSGKQICLNQVKVGDKIRCFDTVNHFDRFFAVKNIYKNKTKCYLIHFDEYSIICSKDHKFLVLTGENKYKMLAVKDFPALPKSIKIISRDGPRFFTGIDELGYRKTIDLEIDSADHNFYCNGIVVSNSHAVGYGLTTLLSVYCKFNHPKEFFLEALEMTQKKADPFSEIEQIQQELPYFGIQLLPPDLVKSDINFKIEGDNIRFGLSAIKGVAEKAIPKLQTFLDKEKVNKFQLFFAAKEAGLNIAILSALIQAGCLHSLGDDRARMTLEAQIWSKLNEREREYCLAHGEKYGYDLITALKDYLNWIDKKPFKESRLDTIRKQTQPYLEIYNKNKRHPQFAAWAYERALLGFCSSYNLRQVFKNELENLQSADSIKNHLDKDSDVYYIGVVGETKKWKSKAGNQCFRMEISDETGVVTAMMTGDKLERHLLASETPKEDEIVYIEGRKADNLVFINRMAVQNYKIAFNMRDLKKLRDKEDSKKESFVDSV